MHQTAVRYRLLRADTEEALLDFVSVACSVWPRFVGLMFRASLPERHGLLLVPCRSVHTMWMRFPVDIFFLSSEGRVVEICRHVRPWRAVVAKSRIKPHAVLETGLDQLHVEVGTALRIESGSDQVLAALRFLSRDVVRTNEE